MKTIYIIVTAGKLIYLQDAVNKRIVEGYFPIGGIATVHTDYGRNGIVEYSQAMILNS